jgi:site-specific recombinase XerD
MKKGVKYPPEPLTGDEVRTLIDAIPKRTTTGKRNRALLAVLYRSGLRISEALSLKPSDIDGLTIRVLHGKGDEARTTSIDDETAALSAGRHSPTDTRPFSAAIRASPSTPLTFDRG